jgi:glucokinase
MSYFYGIDVGGTAVKIGRFNGEKLLERFEFPTNVSDGGRHILSDIAAALREHGNADGAGLGVPGPVLPDGTVNGCVNLGWGMCNPARDLAMLAGLPVRACNDADAAALGEQWLGAGRGLADILLVTLGTGVGAGCVTGGKLLFGGHGAAGELGHLCINPKETRLCSCGNRGCLEQYVGAPGIAALAKKAGMGEITVREVFALAGRDDKTALFVVDRVCEILGRGVAAACAVLDPVAVVLGGGVSGAGELLRAGVEKYFQQYAFHACRDTKIMLAKLGGDAGIYGCARLAME